MRTRRPVVLFAALLAPAILAGGLMAGELTGYQAVVPAPVHRTAGGVAFEPVLAPPPLQPDVTYEGTLPAPERTEQRRPVEPVSVSVPVVRENDAVVVRESPRPVQARTECPGEWEDTWLWELCREHERRPA